MIIIGITETEKIFYKHCKRCGCRFAFKEDEIISIGYVADELYKGIRCPNCNELLHVWKFDKKLK